MEDYEKGPDGVLVVALGEHSAGTLNVTGNAALGGTLFMTRGDELVEDGVCHYLVLVPAAGLALPVETQVFMGTTINLADGIRAGTRRNRLSRVHARAP